MGNAAWAYALARMDVGRATTALYLVPAAAILIALVWLGQVPSPTELIGGVIALAGVVLASGSLASGTGRLGTGWRSVGRIRTRAARWWCAVRA